MALSASFILGCSQRKAPELRIVEEFRLTSTGENRDVAWSPDGRRIAFGSDRNGEYDIWIMDVPEGKVSPEEWERKAICLTGGDGADDLYPVWLPDGRWIAYVSGKKGKWDIWLVSPDGREKRRITDDGKFKSWAITCSPNGAKIAFARDFKLWTVDITTGREQKLTSTEEGRDWLPSWSSDGAKIAFSSNRWGSYDIWVLELATGDLARVTDWPMDEWDPCWSPDGKWLSFLAWKDSTWDVWAMSTSGKEVVRLTHTEEYEFVPRWSPDGSRISFHRTPGAEILLASLSGGETRIIPFHRSLRIRSLAWSPDGKSLAVTWSTAYAQPMIWILDVAEGKVKASVRTAGNVDQLSWSPDGKMLAFVFGDNIWTIQAHGGRLRQVTVEPSNRWPAWSPDCSEIAFASDRTGTYSIWVIPSTGGNPRIVAAGKENFFMPSWSPDGNWIAFLSSCNPEKLPCSPSLWKAKAKGGRPVRLASLNPGIPLALLWSGDGIYYMDATPDRRSVRVWKVPEGGGSPSIVRKVLPPRPLFKPFAGALSSDALAVGLPLRADIWIAEVER